jgi:hypothetical protein
MISVAITIIFSKEENKSKLFENTFAGNPAK